ncbi:MAG: hypothetical protein M1822_003773 [Bathelium mastoideum]|nr:MAG: hypothetical protein M1822_003773 [Bathelium mastoideum]
MSSAMQAKTESSGGDSDQPALSDMNNPDQFSVLPNTNPPKIEMSGSEIREGFRGSSYSSTSQSQQASQAAAASGAPATSSVGSSSADQVEESLHPIYKRFENLNQEQRAQFLHWIQRKESEAGKDSASDLTTPVPVNKGKAKASSVPSPDPFTQPSSSQTSLGTNMPSKYYVGNQGDGEGHPPRKCSRNCGRDLQPGDRTVCMPCRNAAKEARIRTVLELSSSTQPTPNPQSILSTQPALKTQEVSVLQLRPDTLPGQNMQPAPGRDQTITGSTVQKPPERVANPCRLCKSRYNITNHTAQDCTRQDHITKKKRSSRGVKEGYVYPKDRQVSNPCEYCKKHRNLTNHTAEKCRWRHIWAEHRTLDDQQQAVAQPRLPELQMSVSPSAPAPAPAPAPASTAPNEAAEQQIVALSSDPVIPQPPPSDPVTPRSHQWRQDVQDEINERVHNARMQHGSPTMLQAILQIQDEIMRELVDPLSNENYEDAPRLPVAQDLEAYEYITELVRLAEETASQESKKEMENKKPT